MAINTRLAALERRWLAGMSARARLMQAERDAAIAAAIHGIQDAGLRRAVILQMRGNFTFSDTQRGAWADYLRDETNLAAFRRELQVHHDIR